MIKLEHAVARLCRATREGSAATQAARADTLRMAARQVAEKYRDVDTVRQLKPKHIEHLVARWQAEGIAAGTLKNRLSHLRWLAAQDNRPGIIPRSNDELGIERRSYVPTGPEQSRAIEPPTPAQMLAIKSEHVRASLLLQQAFGLRREESIKIRPSIAVQGDELRLKASWCKGGKARTVPIRTDAQRLALDYAAKVAAGGSLVPAGKTYIQHRNAWDRQVRDVGLSRTHGLRHAYAQDRYQELTGWPAPVCGGPTSRDLTRAQKDQDRLVRLLISRELGHEREAITAQYLGR